MLLQTEGARSGETAVSGRLVQGKGGGGSGRLLRAQIPSGLHLRWLQGDQGPDQVGAAGRVPVQEACTRGAAGQDRSCGLGQARQVGVQEL